MQKQKNRSAFTLVELIVVITILAILWTIGMLSFQSYNVFARDSVRLWNLKTLESGLWIMYVQSWNYAVPDNAVEVSSWSSVVILQWEVWKSVQRATKTSQWIWKDPLTEQLITYWTNKNYSKYELMTFLEWDTAMSSSSLKGIIGEFSLAQDINKIKTLWSSVWLLTDENWTPIEKITSIQTAKKLDLAIDTANYVAHFDNEVSKTLSWTTLFNGLLTINQRVPKKCKEWWILVPWNTNFMTNDFCVAQYEMSYNETWPEDVNLADWNTRKYYSTKTPVSMANRLPITEITQPEAIAQCEKIWAHLITNNEWMTIARNIEANPQNWSEGEVWSWYIPNGVSNETANWHWCSWKQWDSSWSWTTLWAWITGSDCSWTNKNRLKLNTWEYIYDMSWNVWEHVNKANTIDWSNFDLWQTSVSWSSNWISWDDNWIYDEIDMLKYGSKKLLWKNNWIWNLYNSNWVANNIFRRGALASDGSYAGVFALDLARTSAASNRTVGFRCVTF